MTVKAITTTTQVVRQVVENKETKTGVQYKSNSSNRAIRITPSSSQAGKFTFTISNPDSHNELAVILSKADAKAFLAAAERFVVYGL